MAGKLVDTHSLARLLDPAAALAGAMDATELRTSRDVLMWWLEGDRLSEASSARICDALDAVNAELRRRKGARHDA